MKGIYKNDAKKINVIIMIIGTKLFLYLSVASTEKRKERFTSVRKILQNNRVMNITVLTTVSSASWCR